MFLKRTASLAAALLTACVGISLASDASADLQRLRGLAGRWHGSVEWTGARTDKGEMDAEYSLTGHGTAVVENLVSRGEVIMTSVYHLDGPTLRMTHYCGVGNQPRLKAADSGDPRRLRFAFVDATNLADPRAPHVDGVELFFRDPAHVDLFFHFTAPKGDSLERIALTRTP
jgi:hypothetical protein